MRYVPLVVLLLACGNDRPSTDQRCVLRVSAKGLYVDGTPRSHDEALSLCKRTAGATVTLEDGAPLSLWRELREELQAVGVTIYLRGPLDDRVCLENPLAKGCAN